MHPKFLAHKLRVMEPETGSFGRLFSLKPYEKNKIAYQDDALFEQEQRNVLAVRHCKRDLMDQTCDNNKINTGLLSSNGIFF